MVPLQGRQLRTIRLQLHALDLTFQWSEETLQAATSIDLSSWLFV